MIRPLIHQTTITCPEVVALPDITVPVGAKQLCVTLAYADYPGLGTRPDLPLNLDLDLQVQAPSLPGGAVTAGAHLPAGVRSNVKKVVIPNPSGTYGLNILGPSPQGAPGTTTLAVVADIIGIGRFIGTGGVAEPVAGRVRDVRGRLRV
jgi:hypothetical protein